MNDDPDILKRRKNRCLGGLIFAAAYVGFFTGMSVDNALLDQLLDWTFSLVVIFLLFGWCYADAEQQEFRLSRIMKFALIFFPYLAFPVYIFKSRGLAGFKTLGLVLCFVVVLLITAGVSILGGYGTMMAFRAMRGY